MSLRDVTFLDAESRTAVLDAADNVALQMDDDAFRGFYERTSRMLWVYLQRMTGDRSAADDLLQETYYRFLRAGVSLETEAHRRHYLFRIATNLSRDRFRRTKTQPVTVEQTETTDALAPAPNAEAARVGSIDLTRAIAQLAPRERAMLWLAYGHGSSHEEIAGVLGLKTSSVKLLLFRARRRLATILGGARTAPGSAPRARGREHGEA